MDYQVLLSDPLADAWSMPPSPSAARFRQEHGLARPLSRYHEAAEGSRPHDAAPDGARPRSMYETEPAYYPSTLRSPLLGVVDNRHAREATRLEWQSDACNDIQSHGLMLAGLSTPHNSRSVHRLPKMGGSASSRGERLARARSSPSLTGSASFCGAYGEAPAMEEQYGNGGAPSLLAPLYGNSQFSAHAGSRPSSPHPVELDAPQRSPHWPSIYLPPTPRSTTLTWERPYRPAHARSISLDYATLPASVPPSARYPRSPSSSTSPNQPSVLASVQHRRLRHPSATSLSIQPIFTLPDPAADSRQHVPQRTLPGAVAEEDVSSSDEPDLSSLWLSRSETTSAVQTPLTAPPDFAGRFDSVDAFLPSPSRFQIAPAKDISMDDSHANATARPASDLPWPLMTPPTSPLWASAPSLPVPPTHFQALPDPTQAPHCRSPPSKPRARSEAGSPNGEKPHRCPYPECGRSFKRHEHLRRHDRMHTKERPYQCEEFGCGLRFSRNDNLLQHQKTHARNGKTKKAVQKRLAEVEAARAARLGFTHTFVSEQY